MSVLRLSEQFYKDSYLILKSSKKLKSRKERIFILSLRISFLVSAIRSPLLSEFFMESSFCSFLTVSLSSSRSFCKGCKTCFLWVSVMLWMILFLVLMLILGKEKTALDNWFRSTSFGAKDHWGFYLLQYQFIMIFTWYDLLLLRSSLIHMFIYSLGFYKENAVSGIANPLDCDISIFIKRQNKIKSFSNLGSNNFPISNLCTGHCAFLLNYLI